MHESKIALVLSGHGFVKHPQAYRFPTYLGTLKTQRGDLEARLELRSPYNHPKLFLTELGRSDLGRPVYPHTLSSGFVCVFEEAMHDVDPYKRAGYLKAFLIHATDLLSMTSEKQIKEEIARDIANHFEGTYAPVFAKKEGFLERRNITPDSDEFGYFPTDSLSGDGVLIKTNALTFEADEKLPGTLSDFYSWLERNDSDAKSRLEQLLKKARSKNLSFSIYLRCSGGIVGMRLNSSSVMPKERPIYAKLRASQFMQHSALQKRAAQRLIGTVGSIEEVLSRDSSSPVGLVDKSIVLVGCGAIGGHLAHLLVQNGAGLGKSHLLLVDPDTLSIPNTLRHRLGAQHYGQYKSTALQVGLKQSYPSVNADYYAGEVGSVMEAIDKADIVVDATGEISVREQLNDWIIARRKSGATEKMLQHCWIEGNGAAAFSFFNDALEGACGRCVRARYHTDEPRYKTVIQPEEYDGVLCGGEVYAPYGPQASIIAAGLAAQHLVEHVNGVSPGTFRSLQIHTGNSRYTKPASPKALKGCPACKGAASD
ncbi:ThiF family adenylyltransferase [Hyphomonas sp.]|uniref:ThiF family adenylyltransferase n=1 Tax=Hyphomonas sp. TaxID=87 RepID=UPI000E00E6F9|nr:ThiF family adenylyltransferase [Hyphomonas sp.]RCL90146.1 MAG: ThiF family adenylyltransferase [Hyphomonas sp.]